MRLNYGRYICVPQGLSAIGGAMLNEAQDATSNVLPTYSESIIKCFIECVQDSKTPSRELRKMAEGIRIKDGKSKMFVFSLAKILGIKLKDISFDKVRLHALEAARRLEK